MKHSLPAVLALSLGVAALAFAEDTFPATLEGHAFLPALSLIAPHADACG